MLMDVFYIGKMLWCFGSPLLYLLKLLLRLCKVFSCAKLIGICRTIFFGIVLPNQLFT